MNLGGGLRCFLLFRQREFSCVFFLEPYAQPRFSCTYKVMFSYEMTGSAGSQARLASCKADLSTDHQTDDPLRNTGIMQRFGFTFNMILMLYS